MNVLVFDTETTSLQKPFCYNLGWVIIDDKSGATVCARDYVIEQVWHNLELFSTAYYAEKRPLYVGRMRNRSVIMDKWGYVCQQMARDIKNYGVEHAYAFNSRFDEKVFDWCCDWYKTLNPLETVMVHDIRGYVHKNLALLPTYQTMCEELGCFTENGNYSTTAETVYKFVTEQHDFAEEHTALSDSRIEGEILLYIQQTFGQDITIDEKIYASIPRKTPKEFWVQDTKGKEWCFEYRQKFNMKDKTGVILK